MPLTGEAKRAYNAKYFANHKGESDEDKDNVDYSVIIDANALRKMGFSDCAVNKVLRNESYKEVVSMTKRDIEKWLAAN